MGITTVIWMILGLISLVLLIKLATTKRIPLEKDVVGKDLPVGSRFLRMGEVIEVVRGKCNEECTYYDGGCYETAPECHKQGTEHFIYFKRVEQ